MRDQGGRPAPSADEIRDIVRRVMDATLPAGAAIPGASPAAAGTGDAGAAAPATGPATAAGGTGKVAVAIGGDHGGYLMKDRIGKWLTENGFEVRDCGTNSPEAVDYPDIAHAVARLVADGTCRWGIVVDGAGIGSCMVANKVPGIRAALCYDISSARNSREHNHANVLTLGAGLIGERLALDIVQTWLGTVWGVGRHAARVDKITAVERRYTTIDKEVRG
jgi:ribose 5-phosphate isomerase B